MLQVAQLTRHAARRLRAAPTFALAAILTLALGIGATTAVFTLVDAVLLRPLPYDHPEQLVDLSHTLAIAGLTSVDQSDASYLLYRRENHVFTDVGAYRATAVNVGGDAGSASGPASTREAAALVTASVFRVLHRSAMIGRTFVESDDEPGAPPVAIISARLWQRAFGGDRAIVGRHLTIDGQSREIVGVMRDGFHFPSADVGVWVPLALDPARTRSAAFDYRGIARLRGGVSPSSAQEDLQRLLPRVPEVFPGRLTVAAILQTGMAARVQPLRDVIIGDVGRVLWIVLGAVFVLLLIACANVANLFLARAESRQRELAVRRALGADRLALLADFASESLLIGVIGGALGLLVAFAGIRMLEQMSAAASIPRLDEVHIDAMAALLSAALAVLSASVVSSLAIVRLNRMPLSAVLASGNRSATMGPARHRVRRALVVAQVAMALVLLTAAGLLTESFARLRAIDPGFVPEHATAFRMSIPSITASTTADAAAIVARTLDAVTALPGVTRAGAITKLPLDAESRQDSAVFIEDHPIRAGEIPPIRQIAFASPSYFDAMHIPIVAGRLFATLDPRGLPAPGTPEVVVSETFATRFWGAAARAIGKRVRMHPLDPWHTIVGVVGSVRDEGLDKPSTETIYCPLVTLNASGTPWIPRNLAFVIRASGDAPIAPSLERALATVNPAIPTYHVQSLAMLVSNSTSRTTFTLFLLAIAGAAATLIGAVGIYGVISYLVNLRTREIGVRIALGADAAAVRRHVTSQALVDAAIGVAIGLVSALALTRSLGAILFDVRPTDPVALAAASALLLVVACAASWLPARRAAAVDPAIALQSD